MLFIAFGAVTNHRSRIWHEADSVLVIWSTSILRHGDEYCITQKLRQHYREWLIDNATITVISPTAGHPESSKSAYSQVRFFSLPVLNLWPRVLRRVKSAVEGVHIFCLFVTKTGCDPSCSMVLCFIRDCEHQVVMKYNHIALFVSSNVSPTYCSVLSACVEQSAFF